jgi:NAD(P)-dependent dehydrogenase (short-subunit alcohol dehydrogenase family)
LLNHKKTVLILGANGFLGRECCKIFAQNGYSVSSADRSGKVDYLLLAESLLLVAEKVNQVAEINFSASCCVALNEHSLNSRLLERIDALVDSEKLELPGFNYQVWLLLSLSLAPFLLLPLHS